jgi:hypothetical protein
MKVVLKKTKKGPVLTCTRRDGSTTYSISRHADFFAYHDLMHFAVETTLGLRNSFYALVAAGRQIPGFNVPGASQALELPVEAGQTEFIVGKLDRAGRELGYAAIARLDPGEVNREIEQSCRNAVCEPPRPLTTSDLGAVAEFMETHAARWQALADGGALALEFPD